MKAIYIEDYGGPEVMRFGDRPTPIPGPHEIAVAVHAASINPIDWKTRAGLVRQHFPLTFPAILGRDFSGVVAALGSDVTDLPLGTAVMGLADPQRGGRPPELIAVGPHPVPRKPPGLEHVQ